MIQDLNLEYGGPVPIYTLEEVKVKFALITEGKVLEDYVTWADEDKPGYWEKRYGKGVGTICMNDLRINYIKKESKCCAGNKNHKDDCHRDIQNVTPFRLSVSCNDT